MLIVGCDFHTGFQQIAMVDTSQSQASREVMIKAILGHQRLRFRCVLEGSSVPDSESLAGTALSPRKYRRPFSTNTVELLTSL